MDWILKNKRKYNEVPVREEIITTDVLSNSGILQYGYGMRHVQMTLIFLCVLTSFMATSQVPVAIVAMTSKSKASNVNHTEEEAIKINNVTAYINVTTTVTGHSIVIDDIDSIYRTYDWSKSVQEMVLIANVMSGSLFILPMGLLVQRFGGKLLLQLSLIVTFVTYIPFPWLTLWGGWKAAVATLFIRGLSLSSLYPAVHYLLANWAPLSERSRLSSFVYAGSNVGTVIAYQVTGVLAESKGGWPCSFWIFGAFNLFVFVIWTVFGAASPSEDKYISAEEKRFILGRLEVGKKPRIPWKSILTSKAVYAILIVTFGSSITFSFMLIQMPTYVHSILKFNIRNSGLVSSLPHIAKIFSAFFFGRLADLLVNRKILSLRTVRIICSSIGEFGAAICLASVSFIQDPTWAIILFISSMGLYSAIYSGWMVNYIDIAPNFTAVLLSIGLEIVTILSFILPVTISHIITDIENIYQWRTVFLLVASLGSVCNAMFVFLMSVDVQPWNEYIPVDAGNNIDTEKKNDTEDE